MRSFFFKYIVVVGLSLASGSIHLPANEGPREIEFGRDVRPILAKNCFVCHGSDESTREADLRLDLRDEAIRDRDGEFAIVPGDTDESLLLWMINAEDEEDIMPPPDSEKHLTEQEKEILEEWIASGADYEEHWSFKAIAEISPLSLDSEGEAWASNEIDAFIWSRLEERGLTPNPEASRETLIRRLYFDLIGMPPSPKEVQAFIDDPSPKAYEKLVEDLLNSPHYGERWARHWLDLAQYADTHGFEKDHAREFAWRYRDYVIDSLNEDKPWSQFVKEQLAGDLLMPGDREGLIATGFVAAGPWDIVSQGLEEDSINHRIALNMDRDNMAHNVAQGLLGVTLQCARCHDHKFDPISQQDYYAMQAIFSGVQRGEIAIPAKSLSRLQRESDVLKNSIIDRDSALSEARDGLEKLRDRLDSVPELGTAFLPLSRKVQNTPAFTTQLSEDVSVWKTVVDLGKSQDISAVFLFPMQVFKAKSRTPGKNFPARFKLEASNSPAFSNEIHVLENNISGAVATNPMSDFYRVSFNPIQARYVRLTVPGNLEDELALSELIILDTDGTPVLPAGVTSNLNPTEVERLMDGWLSTHPFSYDQEFVPGPAIDPVDPGKPATVTILFDDNHWLDSVHVATDTPDAVVVVSSDDEFNPMPVLEGWENPWRDSTGRTFNAKGLRSRKIRIAVEQGRIRDVIVVGRGKQVINVNARIASSENLSSEALNALLKRPRPSGYPLRWATNLSARRADLEKNLADAESALEEAITLNANPEEKHRLESFNTQLAEANTNEEKTYGLSRLPRERPIALLHRGVEGSPAYIVNPSVPALMPHLSNRLDGSEVPRLAFANWLTDPENALFWRNIANRVWMHHFGSGLAVIPDDLGLMGSFPSHPELLDWLADRFRSDGSLKNLHRLILQSAAWRQSSAANPKAQLIDGQNQLLYRANRRRLDAEALHDTYLSIAGQLNTKTHGKGFRRFEVTGTNQPTYHYDQYDPADPETHRRAIYMLVIRGSRDPMMESLDCADPNMNVAQRVETLTAPQALTLVNHPFTIEMAHRFAKRIEEMDSSRGSQIHLIWRIAVNRNPTNEEFLVTQEAIETRGLEAACQLILNSNAFIYLD